LPNQPLGYFSLVLHCHLPFVRHPEHEYFLEEDWYYEALFETYLPLLEKFGELREKGIPFRVTMSLSPTLVSMWADPLLQARALRHLENLLALAQEEEVRLKKSPEFQPVARMYRAKLIKYKEWLTGPPKLNLVQKLKEFADGGFIELMTCAATHGFLPMMDTSPSAVRAQVETALREHEATFGKRPSGFWLPECAYHPGQDEILGECGVRYFLLDTHGLLYANPRPRYGSFAPIQCPSGVSAFARDFESAKQVWSSKEGYPGDVDYRDFYRDVGFDLEPGYVQSYILSGSIRKFTGLKYHRVTGTGDTKEAYDPDKGIRKAEIHAGDFLRKKQAQAREAGKSMDRPQVFLGMYDAELFGHWWYEGPDFLAFLLEKIAGQDEIAALTPTDYLEQHPENQVSTPAFSTWGDGGYAEFWLNPTNDWIYPLLLKACHRMETLADRFPKAEGLTGKALDQASRELLLAQSSDWAFMMKTGHHREYAVRRFKGHLGSFDLLCDQVERGRVDLKFLESLEARDNLFPHMDHRIYKPATRR